MSKRKTKEEFIADAKRVHGDKYDYSLVEYVNNHTKVKVICPKHGVFQVRPGDHLLLASGCWKCRSDRHHKLIYGVGINDVYLSGNRDVYERWKRMLSRCYDKAVLAKQPSYVGCYICDDWRYFSKFKAWYEQHSKPKYAVDKDILFKGNKCYSPETCCCVPPEINALFTKSNRTRGAYPIGVYLDKKSGKFLASIHKYGRLKKLGRFATPQDAFVAYKAAKEDYIKEIAQKYYANGEIEKRVYDALMKYEVEITD